MADITIKKYISGTGWTAAYPETTVGQLVATGTPSSSTFLRGDGVWATPSAGTNNYLTGVSGSGDGTVTFTRSGLSNLTWDASHSHSEYLLTTGKAADSNLLDGIDSSGFINNTHTSHNASDLAVGWYTIATNTGDRAIARFGLRDVDSGRHQSVIFYAAHHFGTDASNTLTVLHESSFGTTPFRYIRIKDGSTYDGAALQVYIDNAQNNVDVYMLGDNFQSSGWVLKDWIADATDPGDLTSYSSFVERGKIDLDNIAQGGMATTGEIYAGGDTTQYRVFHDGYHPNADKWTTARTLTLTGDVTGSVSWDGSGNASMTTAVVNDSHNHDHSDGNFTVNGGLVVEGSIDSGGTNYGNYESAGTNIILKGDGSGRSGLFFESEKNGTNINDPSDYGFIQFHAYGYGGSTGESNGLYLGVANDSSDGVVIQTPYNGQAKIGYKNATSGTSLTTEIIASREWVNSQGFLTSETGDIQGVTAGSGLTGGGTSGTVTISHADTSSQASVNNSGRTYIQDITLDTYGHITGITSATETVVDTNTTYSAGSGLSLSGTTFSHADTSSQASVNNSGRTYIQDITLDTYGHITGITSATETVTDTNTTYSAGTGLSLTGTTFANTAPDQTVTLTGSGATTVSGTYPNFTISSTDTNTNTTYSAGSGLSLSGTTFSHSDTSSQASVNNSGNTFVQDITLDTYGHITGITSATASGGSGATWQLIRSRGATTNLTATAFGTTASSVTVSSLSAGDTIAIEVNEAATYTLTPKIVIVNIYSDTTPTSNSQATGWIAADSTRRIKNYSFKVSASGTTVYFDDAYFGSADDINSPANYLCMSNIISESTFILYVGKIWRIV